MMRSRVCPICGDSFEYETGIGKDRKICLKIECRKESNRQAHRRSAAKRPTCIVPGCLDQARDLRTGWCETHYYRHRRTGTTDLTPHPVNRLSLDANGYVVQYAPGHPLTVRLGRPSERQHRIVFYDHNGEGPFDCHWCGRVVTWDDMHVDHLNGIRDDNRIDNLVASCPPCNHERGYHKVTRTARRLWGKPIEWRGQSRTLTEWSDLLGISVTGLRHRLDKGWSLDRAFTQPVGPTGPRRTAKLGRWRIQAADIQ